MSKTYIYIPSTKIMRCTEKVASDVNIVIEINLKKTTITYMNNGVITETNRKMNDGDFYVFLDFMNHIEATNELMDALLANPYYTKQYLKTSLGVFNTPVEDTFLHIFPSFILPYEALYRELKLKPRYASRILSEYDKNNSIFIRKFKEFVRMILVIPGIVCSPLILISIYPAIKNLR